MSVVVVVWPTRGAKIFKVGQLIANLLRKSRRIFAREAFLNSNGFLELRCINEDHILGRVFCLGLWCNYFAPCGRGFVEKWFFVRIRSLTVFRPKICPIFNAFVLNIAVLLRQIKAASLSSQFCPKLSLTFKERRWISFGLLLVLMELLLVFYLEIKRVFRYDVVLVHEFWLCL